MKEKEMNEQHGLMRTGAIVFLLAAALSIFVDCVPCKVNSNSVLVYLSQNRKPPPGIRTAWGEWREPTAAIRPFVCPFGQNALDLRSSTILSYRESRSGDWLVTERFYEARYRHADGSESVAPALGPTRTYRVNLLTVASVFGVAAVMLGFGIISRYRKKPTTACTLSHATAREG